MHSIAKFISVLSLASSVLAQYSDYGSSSDSSDYGSSSDSSSNDATSAENASVSSSVTPDVALASSPPASSPATPGVVIDMHVVKVSNKNGDLVFEPNNFQAATGSMVQFQYWPKNHSVVQSTFDQPCVPIHNVNASVTGFFSGFMPVQADSTTRPIYTILINDTKPIWFYCSQGKHCQAGMVGVINPPAQNKSRTIDSFTELAAQAPANVSPSLEDTSGGTGSNAPTGSTGTAATGTNAGATAAYTGSANAFAKRQGTWAILGLAGLLGVFMSLL